MSNQQTTLNAPQWLRCQGRSHTDMGPCETEWCDRMNSAADEIERLYAAIEDCLVGACEAQDGNLRREMVLIRQPAFATLCQIVKERM